MNRHWVIGFQTNVKNDPYYIEERLQDYDKHLYLMWNPSTNEHLIMDDITNTAVMKIPQMGFEVLDSRVVSHIKKIHTANGFNASYELQESEERRRKEEQKKQDDLAYNFAKDSMRAVKNVAYGYA